MNKYKSIIFLFLSLAVTAAAYAHDTTAVKKPVVILVQLRTEINKINALTKAKNYAVLEEVKRDASEVRRLMMLDFTLNFHRCPVYYFMDTNIDYIKNKQFDGVLLDTSGAPVTNPLINSASSNYWIVYYGYHIHQARKEKVVTDKDRYTYDSEHPQGKGLVVLNDQFQQITFFYKYGYDDVFFGKKSRQKKLMYSSKKFDIDYFPFAKMLHEKDMSDRYSRRHVKK